MPASKIVYGSHTAIPPQSTPCPIAKENKRITTDCLTIKFFDYGKIKIIAGSATPVHGHGV